MAAELAEIADQTHAAVEYVIDIVRMQKSFRRQTRARSGYTTLKSAVVNLFKSRAGAAEDDRIVTHAIKDLTLRIPKGSSVGLIGRNGSGKSTFLKLVTGIYKPDSGTVSVKGRVAALIELGAGFHPDFTGRENLMLAGVMHGLTRDEIEARFDDIVQFAELESVIDDPVRTYSSGMFMRLGFSIAIHTDPDVLLVDEVLAVGDAGFVAKCKDRIAELRKQGKTLVLVTHDLEAVERWCDEVIWLHAGEVRERGYPRRVIDAYRSFIEKGEEAEIFEEEREHARTEEPVTPGEAQKAARWGSREIEIESVELLSGKQPKRVFHPEEPATIRIAYRVHAEQDEAVFGIGINRADGIVVFGSNTDIERFKLPRLSGRGTIEFQIQRLGLLEGAFALDVAVHRTDGYPYDYHKDVIHFTVRSDKREVGVCTPPHQWLLNGDICR
jgi:ABC-type polysaccharide/polyol phosphate transport system ATPase subunit